MHELFGTKHIILIVLSIVLIIVGTIFLKKLPLKSLFRVMLYVGICSEIIKIFYYIIINEGKYGGILPKSDLPFHLCSIQIIFFVILGLSSNQKIQRFFLSFMMPSCLIGGFAAILIATDSSRNGAWIITAQYFIYHAFLVIFALSLLTTKEITFEVKDYFNCLKFLLVIMFFAFYINSIVYDAGGAVDVNFMYVSGPPQKGLPFLNEDHGWLVYIIHYACLVLFCVTICYVKPIISAIKEKFAHKNVSEQSESATLQ